MFGRQLVASSLTPKLLIKCADRYLQLCIQGLKAKGVVEYNSDWRHLLICEWQIGFIYKSMAKESMATSVYIEQTFGVLKLLAMKHSRQPKLFASLGNEWGFTDSIC